MKTYLFQCSDQKDQAPDIWKWIMKNMMSGECIFEINHTTHKKKTKSLTLPIRRLKNCSHNISNTMSKSTLLLINHVAIPRQQWTFEKTLIQNLYLSTYDWVIL